MEYVLFELGDDDFIEALDGVQRVLHRAAEFARQIVELFAADFGRHEVFGQSHQFHAYCVVDLRRRWRRRIDVSISV